MILSCLLQIVWITGYVNLSFFLT